MKRLITPLAVLAVLCTALVSQPADAQAAGTCNGQKVTVSIAAGDSPTNGDDVILGTSKADVINALSGNDVICARGGADTILGGDGNDVIFGGPGSDTINGQVGDDRIAGGNDADTIRGAQGNDRIVGGSGGDFISGGGGNDRLFGQGGNDRILGGDGDDLIVGKTGSDTLFGGPGKDTMKGGSGNDVLEGGGGDDPWIMGGRGADTLRGDGGNDVLRGHLGKDTMYGGEGNDDMKGGLDDDVLTGGAGSDTMFGKQGNDTLYGNGDADVLWGSKGNDTLDGGSSTDTCHGGPGNDTTKACEGPSAPASTPKPPPTSTPKPPPTSTPKPPPTSTPKPTTPPSPASEPDPTATPQPPTNPPPKPDLPAPGANPNLTVAFSEDFSSESALDRFNWQLHTGGANGGTPDSWLGDHSESCEGPGTTRVISKPGLDITDPGDTAYWCAPKGPASGHLMTSMNTGGYEHVDFSPARTFNSVSRVCWAQNMNYLGRKWTQVAVISEAKYQAAGERLDYVKRSLDETAADGGVLLSGDDFLFIYGGGYPKVEVGQNIEDSGRRGFTTLDKARRHLICLEDLENGTIRVEMERESSVDVVLLQGSMPEGPARVIFQDVTYNATKNPSPLPNPFTWHWDDITIETR